LIEVKHLTKIYGEKKALDDVSFKVANGKIYGLLGPNGAGKSTTMNIMTGCLAATEGTVKINGFDIYRDAVKAKQLIGYLPELPPLYEDMTPAEFLAFVAEAKGVDPERVARQVREVMESTDITDMKDRLIRNLSKGCRQRVGIAQAILGNPEIIILDEPTVGLDPKQLVEIRGLIRRLGESRTVIVSSHILAEVSELCDELLVISDGRLVAQGALSELESMIGDAATLHLVVRGDKEGVLSVLDGIVGRDACTLCPVKNEGEVIVDVSVSRESDIRDSIFFAMADRRYAVLTMEMEHKSLESVFLTLTGATKKDGPSDDDDEYEDDEEYEEDEA
jgi:ABC-2 type transport system ATP-binding protein